MQVLARQTIRKLEAMTDADFEGMRFLFTDEKHGTGAAGYFSTQRPVGPGTFPKQDGIETVTNFDAPTYCEEIGQKAWD